MLRGNPLMKACRSFSVFSTMFRHRTVKSWNLLTCYSRIGVPMRLLAIAIVQLELLEPQCSLCPSALAHTQNLVLMHHNRPQSRLVHREVLTLEHCIASPSEYGKLLLVHRPIHMSYSFEVNMGEGLCNLDESLDKSP
ncbi:hypothetical protein Tco_0845104 [Tanacetum coccineum]